MYANYSVTVDMGVATRSFFLVSFAYHPHLSYNYENKKLMMQLGSKPHMLACVCMHAHVGLISHGFIYLTGCRRLRRHHLPYQKTRGF